MTPDFGLDPFDTRDRTMQPMETAPHDTAVLLLTVNGSRIGRYRDGWKSIDGADIGNEWIGWLHLHDEEVEMYGLL
jgi:hypothetical protein